MKKMALVAVAIFTASGAPQAHHSGSMYQTTPVWIEGTVVDFATSGPHSLTTLEQRSEDGRVRHWLVEGPPIRRLDLFAEEHFVLVIGDFIGFCAFPYKSRTDLQRLFPEADFSGRRLLNTNDPSTQAVAGQVMLLPGGGKQFLEPHGVISECIRNSDEPRQSWVDFLNSDEEARNGLCQQRDFTFVRSDASLSELIDQINGLIVAPCP